MVQFLRQQAAGKGAIYNIYVEQIESGTFSPLQIETSHLECPEGPPNPAELGALMMARL